MIGRFGKFLVAAGLSTAAMLATPVTVTFTNGGSIYDSNIGEDVGPYNAVVNGVSMKVYCDDLLNTVNNGDVWNANITQLTALPTTPAVVKFAALTNSTQLYTEVAWLMTQFAGKSAAETGAIQAAMWKVFDSSAPHDPGQTIGTTLEDSTYWFTQAGLASNYNTVNKSNFEILTYSTTTPLHTSTNSYNNSPQEFIIMTSTPEPATYALFGSGIILLSLGSFRRRPRKNS